MIYRRRLVVTSLALTAFALTGCSSVNPEPSSQEESTPAPARPLLDGTVWVANEEGNSLTVLDAATNQVVTTLTGIESPHNVQTSQDGSIAYAVSGHDNTVVAIDSATYAVSAIGGSGLSPAHVIDSADGTKVYTTNAGDGTVSVFAGPALELLSTIDLGGMPHGLRAAANGSQIAVANTEARTVDLIDARTDVKTAAVPVGGSPVQVAIDADGRFAYASIAEPASVEKIDLELRKVVASVAVSASPLQIFLAPGSRTLVSANQGTSSKPGNTVSVIDTATMAVRDTVRAGSGPHGVVIDPTGTRAWVTNLYDDTVTIIDLPTRAVVETVTVGNLPNGVSYSSRQPAAAQARTIKLEIPEPSQMPDSHDQSMQMPMTDD